MIFLCSQPVRGKEGRWSSFVSWLNGVMRSSRLREYIVLRVVSAPWFRGFIWRSSLTWIGEGANDISLCLAGIYRSKLELFNIEHNAVLNFVLRVIPNFFLAISFSASFEVSLTLYVLFLFHSCRLLGEITVNAYTKQGGRQLSSSLVSV